MHGRRSYPVASCNMSEGRIFANAPTVATAAAAAAIMECALAYLWLRWKVSTPVALVAHSTIVAAIALATRRPRAEDVRLPMLVTCSTAALGPIGAVGSLLTLVLARQY